jgi:hypothetical protein
VVLWFRQSSEYVGMFQQHQALEVGGAASSCVQRHQTLKVDEQQLEQYM